MQAKIIWPEYDALGESPLWHVKEQVLYWVDIANQVLHRLDPITKDYQQWKMPAKIGCIAPRQTGGLIAVIGEEICFIDLPNGNVIPQIKVPGGLRLNDGKCDRQGRFWFGQVDIENANGHLFRYEPDGKLHVMESGIAVSNGLAWSLDNNTFYYTDSPLRKIYKYDFDVKTGEISNRKVFVETPEGEGFPDGLTIDNEGCIWSARWNGFKIARYKPDGILDTEVKLPVQRPTSCIFGGKNLDVLYITTCSCDVGEEEVLPEPAGALFAIKTTVKGLPEGDFFG